MSNIENLTCPVCGYYCLGKGGAGCIDKPTLLPRAVRYSKGKKEERIPMKRKIMTSKEYAKSGGNKCPVCHADGELDGWGTVEIDGKTATQAVACNNCDSEWVDCYALTGYENLQINEDKQ